MIKKITRLICLMLFLPTMGLAETTSDQPDSMRQSLAAFVEKNNTTDAAFLIYQDGKLHAYYFGEAKPTTTFELGSLSDILTGLVLAQQVDAAKVQLTTPLKQFNSTLPEALGKITLRSLATNTSGLPASAPANYLADPNQTNVIDEIWQPSTIGMTLLTKALQDATHKSMAELYQHQIFAVLSMKTAKLSDTGLKATAPDMQKFLSAAIGLPGTPEIVLYPMRLTQTAFVELQNQMVGLGWDIDVKSLTEDQEADNGVLDVPTRPVFKADRTYEKTSGNAFMAVLPNKKSGVVILLSRAVNQEQLALFGRQLLQGVAG